jgi:hypothetical protein
MSALKARDGILIDLDFTGKLDLVVVAGETNDLRIARQAGPLNFKDVTGGSGIPESLHNFEVVMMEDWNRDGIMDIIASRKEGPPLLLEKQRGGPLVSREQTGWAAGHRLHYGRFR